MRQLDRVHRLDVSAALRFLHFQEWCPCGQVCGYCGCSLAELGDLDALENVVKEMIVENCPGGLSGIFTAVHHLVFGGDAGFAAGARIPKLRRLHFIISVYFETIVQFRVLSGVSHRSVCLLLQNCLEVCVCLQSLVVFVCG